MVDFSKLGKTVLGDLKPPPVPPNGTYFGTISAWKWAESRWKNKETGQSEAQVHFTLRGLEFGDDIEEADRAGVDLKTKIVVAEQGCQSDAQVFYMQELLTALGIDCSGKTLEQCLPDSVGLAVMFEGVQRATEKGAIFNVRKMRARQ